MENLSERETTQLQPAESGVGAAEQVAASADSEPATAESSRESPPTNGAEAASETGENENAEAAAAAPIAQAEAGTPPAHAETAKGEAAEPEAAPPSKPAAPRLAELRAGAVIEGRVTRIERYGAFVDLGLLERRDGLIHISELAPYRVRRVEDVVHVGDSVRVRIVSVDPGRARVALSLNDVDAEEYNPAAATRSNEPVLTSMALAFERAYDRLKEKDNGGNNPTGREDRGSRKKREHEKLMEKFRSKGS